MSNLNRTNKGQFKKGEPNFFVLRESIVEMHLNHSRITLLDFNDWLKVYEYHWIYHLSSGYAVASSPKTHKELRLHKILTGYVLTDHCNRNKLDNRSANLRSVTKSENCYNIDISKRNKSGYRGVSNAHYDGKLHPHRWKAQIKYRGKVIHIGLFNSKDEAALAYNEKAKELFGELAWVNQIDSMVQDETLGLGKIKS